jgi:hypothetical protein
MKDFSFWQKYEGLNEGSGRSEKTWLINPDTMQTGLFKVKKGPETTDNISECLAGDIAYLLGIPCAKCEVGRYNGRTGSISYNIVTSQSIHFSEGISYITETYPSYDPDKFRDTCSGDRYSVEMIYSVLGRYHGVFEQFLRMLIFDYMIGNSDRHQSNWALLEENGKTFLSPLYDNSSSLCAYLSEKEVILYLGNDTLRWKSLVDTKSKSLIRILRNDEKRPTHFEMVEYFSRTYYTETQSFVKEIGDKLTDEEVNLLTCKYLDEGLSVERKNLIIKFLLSKRKMLTDLYKQKEV